MGVRELLQAIGDPVRFRIVEALRGGPRCVAELVEELGLPQPNVSRHLKALRERGVIEAAREGRWVRYRIVPAALEAIHGWSRRTAGGGEARPLGAARSGARGGSVRDDRDDPILFTR